MGQSADAELFYGYIWTPPKDSYDESVSWWQILGMGEDDLDESGMGDDLLSVLAEVRGSDYSTISKDLRNRYPNIEEGFSSDCNWNGAGNTPILYVKTTVQRAEVGMPLSFRPEDLAVPHEAEELARFIEEFKVSTSPEQGAQGPGWFITVSYG
jgi:hypothetical protein